MKTHTKIAWILALIVTIILFGGTFIQFPTTNMVRVLGQFAGSASVGIVVFLISYGIGALVVRVKRRLR